MGFGRLVAARRSVRAYASQPVDEPTLQRILQAVSRAPSAGNLQAYEICLVRSPEARAALSRAAGGQSFIEEAPLALVFCTNAGRAAVRYGHRGSTLYTVQDATIACTYAMLAAVDEGLACVWVGAFDEGAVRQVVGAPAEWVPIAVLPIGHAAETPPAAPRRALSDLVHETR
jgi:nitroreductase